MKKLSMSLTVKPFRYGDDKDRMVKLLEEAAEAYAAWQRVDDLYCYTPSHCCECKSKCAEYIRLGEEVADCITICCNIANDLGIDLQAALDNVERKNWDRGYYS